MKTLISIIRNNIKYRGQILELAKANQKKKYKGSDLGILWAFIKPAMYIGVFYAAISLGFKGAKDVQDILCPYFIWLTIGMVAWFYMRDMLVGGAGAYRKLKAYVTKTNYSADVIPSIISISNLLIHFVVLIGALLLTIGFGVYPSIYWIEILFYMILMVIFATFWSMATGMISAVNKDFYNLLQAISQAIFWLSAIIFDINSVDNEIIQTIFLFNPITYIVEGYRNAVCRHIWFWDEPQKLLCYIVSLTVMVFLAVICYKKFRKVIPDYL